MQGSSTTDNEVNGRHDGRTTDDNLPCVDDAAAVSQVLDCTVIRVNRSSPLYSY